MIDTEKLMHIRDTILYRNDNEKKNAYRQCIEYVIEQDRKSTRLNSSHRL